MSSVELLSKETSPILPAKPCQSATQSRAMKLTLAFLVLAICALASLFIWLAVVRASNLLRSHSVEQNPNETCNQANSTVAAPTVTNSIETNNSTNSSLTNSQEKSNAVRETWGKRCDKLLFVEKGSRLAEINGILRVPIDKESRAELYHKVIEASTYVYEKYLNDYDWFMKADDDTYVIVEHLKQFLSKHGSPVKPIYFGYKFKPYVHQGYMSGGSGYVMSRQALKLLVEKGFKPKRDQCHMSEGEVEDMQIGICLESVGVEAGDSRDSQGRPTFLPLAPDYLIDSREIDKDFWYYSYGFYGPPKPGKDCCSAEPISFHYIEPKTMRLIDWLLYDVKPINKAQD